MKRIEGCSCDEREHCNWSWTGWLGSRAGEKNCQWKRWYTPGPTWAAFLGKKGHPAHSWDDKRAQRQTRLLSTHSHHFTFLFFPNSHDFFGCVINHHQIRLSPNMSSFQLWWTFPWVNGPFFCETHLNFSITALPSHTAKLWFTALLAFFATNTVIGKCQIVDLAVRL